MVSFRRCILALAILALFTGLTASANTNTQVTPINTGPSAIAAGTGTMNLDCTMTAAEPNIKKRAVNDTLANNAFNLGVSTTAWTNAILVNNTGTVSMSFAPTTGTNAAVFRITNIAAIATPNNARTAIASAGNLDNNNDVTTATTTGANNGGVANATEIVLTGNTLGSVVNLRVSIAPTATTEVRTRNGPINNSNNANRPPGNILALG